MRSNKSCLVAGPRPGGQEEGWAGENQEPEEKVQTENPGEHSETERHSAEEENDEEKTKEKEKSSGGISVKTPAHIFLYICFITCAISCNISLTFANKSNAIKNKRSGWQPLLNQVNKGITMMWWNFTANKTQIGIYITLRLLLHQFNLSSTCRCRESRVWMQMFNNSSTTENIVNDHCTCCN